MTIRNRPAIQASLILALCLFPVCLAQPVAFFPLGDVKPGLTGVGKTIFEGVAIEEFDVEILGVRENIRPQRNLILSRLSGAPPRKIYPVPCVRGDNGRGG